MLEQPFVYVVWVHEQFSDGRWALIPPLQLHSGAVHPHLLLGHNDCHALGVKLWPPGAPHHLLAAQELIVGHLSPYALSEPMSGFPSRLNAHAMPWRHMHSQPNLRRASTKPQAAWRQRCNSHCHCPADLEARAALVLLIAGGVLSLRAHVAPRALYHHQVGRQVHPHGQRRGGAQHLCGMPEYRTALGTTHTQQCARGSSRQLAQQQPQQPAYGYGAAP